jgi:hypothetical protein
MSSKSVKKCQSSYCKNYTRKGLNMLKVFTDNMSKTMKKRLDVLAKKKNRTKEEDEKLDLAKTFYNSFTKNIKKEYSKTSMKKKEKELMELCTKSFCNPECKETIFDESTKELPKHLIKQFKDSPESLKIFTNIKKELFKGKKTILKDGFYEGLKSNTIKKLKSEGAISGCAKMILH